MESISRHIFACSLASRADPARIDSAPKITEHRASSTEHRAWSTEHRSASIGRLNYDGRRDEDAVFAIVVAALACFDIMSGYEDSNKLFAELTHVVQGLCSMQLRQDERDLLTRLKAYPLVSSPESSQVIRSLLEKADNDIQKNDKDPYEDGDQRIVSSEPKAQILRELFSMGGDIEHCLNDRNTFSNFAWSCIQGDVAAVEQAICKTIRGTKERHELLERRATSMRLPPLLLTLALSKHPHQVQRYAGTPVNKQNHVGVFNVLLRYGARPDSRDVTGKTVIHYGAGSWATEKTLVMSEACIIAHKSSALFGEEVVLMGLQSEKYNGAKCTLGGFDTQTLRRVVHLHEEDRELAVKPENIFDSDGECIFDKSRRLTDIADRVGSISLHEVVMSTRDDVARFLLDKHNTSLDVAELSGTTPRAMALNTSPLPGATVNEVIKKHAVKKSRKAEKKKEDSCFKCQTNHSWEELALCKRCRYALYCSRECQVHLAETEKAICVTHVENPLNQLPAFAV